MFFLIVGSLLAFSSLVDAAQNESKPSLIKLEEQAFQEAVATVSPSLVRIETVGGREVVQSQLTSTAASTGVVVSPDGYIITSSYHFLSKPSSIIVQLFDGRRFPAETVSQDEILKVTLLKIETGGLIVPPAVDAEEIKVGQWALALGKTYSAEVPNLSVGVVSALNRVWGKAVAQTDAKISPVNYGGPLVDIQGRVMGILVPLSPDDNTVQAGTDWYDSGIGFAVSFPTIQQHLDEMKTGKELKRGLLGVVVEKGETMGGPAAVEQVRFGSPAEDAGIGEGDVIVKINDLPIETQNDFKFAMGTRYAGETLQVGIKNKEETRTVEATLVDELLPYESGFIGILAERKSLGSAEPGIAVRYVYPDSPADQAGIKPGDRLIKFNEETIERSAQMEELIGSNIVDDEVDVVVLQNGEEQSLKLKLASKNKVSLPDELEPALVPALDPNALPEGFPKTGRLSEELEELKHRFWAYVPEDYNPDFPYSLLVWIHPAGQSMEAPMMKAFRAECDKRGIILLAPLAAEEEGWSNEEFEFIEELIETVRERYFIDPWRTVVFSTGDSSRFATQFVLRQPEQVAGLALSNSLILSRPPEPEPGLDLSFFLGAASDFQQQKQLEQVVEQLQNMKHEAILYKSESDSTTTFPEDLIERLCVWIDSLDRI
ncbi:PDZ domain-containing protein [Polystyrenella longa]|uniref:PDZ domain-containing protein n=1 Tax=Polystyrenella longa TaxID=2528007 RepID=UPI0018D264FE|nr:PDZ domain-containing protein [Polystyrenella longa]